MSPAARQYLELLRELVLARQQAGGSLSQEEESGYVAALDTRWWEMPQEEREGIDAFLSKALASGQSSN